MGGSGLWQPSLELRTISRQWIVATGIEAHVPCMSSALISWVVGWLEIARNHFIQSKVNSNEVRLSVDGQGLRVRFGYSQHLFQSDDNDRIGSKGGETGEESRQHD
ncbi:hypothetical protein ACLOJK_030776 [Asimina triloba]